MKKRLVGILLFFSVIPGKAQYFYGRLDIGTGNIYSFVASNLATAGLNALANRMLFDNSFVYTFNTPTDSRLGPKGCNLLGLSIPDLLNDITFGGKFGLQTSSPGTVNIGGYVSAHYRNNQFYFGPDEMLLRVQRHQLGGGVFFNFGGIEDGTHLLVELGLRFETPFGYSSAFGNDALASGLVSHYAIRVNGNGYFQGLGIYADIPHYEMFKSVELADFPTGMKMYSIGIMYTITPWRIKKMY